MQKLVKKRVKNKNLMSLNKETGLYESSLLIGYADAKPKRLMHKIKIVEMFAKFLGWIY